MKIKVKHKKAQVIYFIIVGILLAMAILMFFFFRSSTLKEQQIEAFKKEVILDASLKPIHTYLTTCFQSAIADAIIVVASNGGEKNITGVSYSLMPENADYISTLFSGKAVLLYKYVFGSGISVRFVDPDKVKENIINISLPYIERCVKKTEDHIKNVNIIPKEKPEILLIIRNDSVIAGIKYPLDIITKIDKKKRHLERFYIEVDARLGYLINSVNQFLRYLSMTRDIETQMNGYFSFFKGIGKDRFPPMFYVSDKFKMIDKKHLEELFPDIMLGYAARLKVMNTLKFPYFSQGFLHLVPFIDYHDIDVVLYPPENLKPIFKIYPNPESPMIIPKAVESNSDQGILRFFSKIIPFSTTPRFAYSAIYTYALPFVVVFRDPKSFAGQGLSFKFGILPAICQDQPCRINLENPYPVNENDRFCSAKITKIQFKPVDDYGNVINPERIKIKYVCGDYKCLYYKENVNISAGKIKLKVPQCLNASLIVEIPGYLRKEINDLRMLPMTFNDLGNVMFNEIIKINSSNIHVGLYKDSLYDLNRSLLSYTEKINKIKTNLKPLSSVSDHLKYFVLLKSSKKSDMPLMILSTNMMKENINMSFFFAADNNASLSAMLLMNNLSLLGCIVSSGSRIVAPLIHAHQIMFDEEKAARMKKVNELLERYSNNINLLSLESINQSLHNLTGIYYEFLILMSNQFNLTEDQKNELKSSAWNDALIELLNDKDLVEKLNHTIEQYLDYLKGHFNKNSDHDKRILANLIFYAEFPEFLNEDLNNDDFFEINGFFLKMFPISSYNIYVNIDIDRLKQNKITFVLPYQKPPLDMCDLMKFSSDFSAYDKLLIPIFG